jgi:hypothetical protein
VRTLRLGCLAALVAVTAFAGGASACACGAMVAPTETPGQRIKEWSIVHFDGQLETIQMKLSLTVPLDHAALVLPVRPGAAAILGDDAAFDRVDTLTRPRIEHRNRYHAGFSPGHHDELDTAAAPLAAGGGGPAVTVVGAQDLGPLHVVTLRSRSSSALETWLRDNGFPLPSGLADGTQGYLDEGWDLMVAKLRAAAAGTPLRSLQPLVVTFPATKLVYPLRLSRMAPAGSTARVDVYAPWRVGYGDYPGVEVLYAGRSGSGWLTSLRFTIDSRSPDADPPFAKAAGQQPFQRVTVVYDDVYIADTAAPIAAGVLGALLAFWLVRRRARRRRTA